MIKIAWGDIVLGLVFFILLAWVFLTMIGTPECESMANKTALNLKYAIDAAAKDHSQGGLPEWDGSGVPNDKAYYNLADITLCQEHGQYSYLLQFAGGMPEYQIYYEQFPESGGGVWNEAYPWSGGAAGSLVFWGAMRGINLGFTLTKAAIFKSLSQLSIFDGLKEGWNERWLNVQDALTGAEKFDSTLTLTDTIEKFHDEGRMPETIYQQLATSDEMTQLQLLIENDFLETDAEGNLYVVGENTLVLKKDPVPLQFLKYDSAGSVVERKNLFVYCPGCAPGGVFDKDEFVNKADWSKIQVLDVGQAAPAGYVQPEISPREMMKNYVNDLAKTDPVQANDIGLRFAISDANGVPETLTDYALKTTWTQDVYDHTIGRVKEIIDNLKQNFYVGEGTVLEGKEAVANTYALYALVTDPTCDSDPACIALRDQVIGQLIDPKNDLGITDRLRYYGDKYLGLGPGVNIDAAKAAEIINRVWEEEGGGEVFFPKTALANIFTIMNDELIKSNGVLPGGYSDWVAYLTDVAKTNSLSLGIDYNGLFSDYANVVDSTGKTKMQEIAQSLYTDYSSTIGIGQSDYEYKVAAAKTYWLHVGGMVDGIENPASLNPVTLDGQKKVIGNELSNIVGYFKKDYSSMAISLSWDKKFALYGINEGKKLAFIDGTAMVAPNSWFWKGFMATQMTEGCQGNSICLYTHAANTEGPTYLENYTQKYFVRVWRPVEWWENYAGLQALLNRIPEHPRFYIVSPCMAVAKVWKTTYNGEPTIFVYPEKVDMGGNASNYCYADDALIHEYTAIWFGSDIMTLVTTFLSFGGTRVLPKAVQSTIKNSVTAFNKVVKVADPVTFGQCLLEAAISWPGYPYKSMGKDELAAAATGVTWNNLKQTLEKGST
jgi:hypothetical protein